MPKTRTFISPTGLAVQFNVETQKLYVKDGSGRTYGPTVITEPALRNLREVHKIPHVLTRGALIPIKL